METIIDIRKNQIEWKLGESNFQKLNLFRLMETDFRAFFLLVEIIIFLQRFSFKRKLPLNLVEANF